MEHELFVLITEGGQVIGPADLSNGFLVLYSHITKQMVFLCGNLEDLDERRMRLMGITDNETGKIHKELRVVFPIEKLREISGQVGIPFKRVRRNTDHLLDTMFFHQSMGEGHR